MLMKLRFDFYHNKFSIPILVLKTDSYSYSYSYSKNQYQHINKQKIKLVSPFSLLHLSKHGLQFRLTHLLLNGSTQLTKQYSPI